MARPPRVELPGVPLHVVQRGNNRLPCFLDDDDRQWYLQCLLQALRRFEVRLHAYVLMGNHVHLLLTPGVAGALSRMMHAFGRNYAGLFNGRHGRKGTLWEGRYKACLVDSGRYFLACSCYIELNPVRAWMAAGPGEYPWSSYASNALGKASALITPHACYVALGSEPTLRASAYRTLFSESMPDALLQKIRMHLRQEKALGTDGFRAWVTARTGKFAEVRPVGRPPRHSNCP